MEVNQKDEIENHSGDGGNWSDSIATEFIDENLCQSTVKKESTDHVKESVTPMPIHQQHGTPYQQLMHTFKGPSTVDQQNQILHLLKSNPSLMSTFKKQKKQQSRLNSVIDTTGSSQIQQPSLQQMYPQQMLHPQQHQQKPVEDHRVLEQQLQGHSKVAPGVQFPEPYGVTSGPAGQIGAESCTSLVHNRAYDQLIDSLKRATTTAQQKKILHTLRSNPSLMAVYLNKCKQQNGEQDGRADLLDHNQSNQQQSMQHMLPQHIPQKQPQHNQQQHQCQPGMEINGQMPQVGLICKENISTVHDEAYQHRVPTLKSPNSPSQKQQVHRNVKGNPSTIAALRKHRQKQVGQNSVGAASLVPNQAQNQESSLKLMLPQNQIQQPQQYKNQVYQQQMQQPQHQSQNHQEPPVGVEAINQIDSENTALRQSAAYQKLTEILKRPNTPERQTHIVHLVKSNPLLRAAFAKKRQSIDQQSGIVNTVAQNITSQQPALQHVLSQQQQYQINQQLQPQCAQQLQPGLGGTSSMQNKPSHHLMTALKGTSSPEKINQIIHDLQSKPGISDFPEHRQQCVGHERVHPLHTSPPQQQQPHLQQILFQQQNQQSQPQYLPGPSAQHYQHEVLTHSPPSYNQQSSNCSSSLNYGGFEQNYGQTGWNPASPMQQLRQLVETPSAIFSTQSNPHLQSVPTQMNHLISSSRSGPGPSPHYHHQHHHLSHENQNYSLDDELNVPSGLLSLEPYPVNSSDTSEMLKITPQDLLDFVNKF